jgi:hypothetical protein
MTVFGKLTGLTGRKLTAGGHRLRDVDVMRPTHPHAITPTNPGAMAHARSVPVLTHPRYFKPGEGQALAELAHRRRIELSESKRAYSALKSIERSDAQLTETHRQYEVVVSSSELHKKAADVQYARHLHHQRPEYAMLHRATRQARVDAGDMISRYMATAHQLAGV